jgi:hypothetical protein
MCVFVAQALLRGAAPIVARRRIILVARNRFSEVSQLLLTGRCAHPGGLKVKSQRPGRVVSQPEAIQLTVDGTVMRGRLAEKYRFALPSVRRKQTVLNELVHSHNFWSFSSTSEKSQAFLLWANTTN